MNFKKTLITYCTDTDALAREIAVKFPTRLDVSDPSDVIFKVVKTPTIRKDNLTLTAVMSQSPEEEAMLSSLDNLEVLGTYEEIFASPTKDAKYQSVYPYSKTITSIDELGNTVTYKRPKKIGDFA